MSKFGWHGVRSAVLDRLKRTLQNPALSARDVCRPCRSVGTPAVRTKLLSQPVRIGDPWQ
jgi:hypothetical protein